MKLKSCLSSCLALAMLFNGTALGAELGDRSLSNDLNYEPDAGIQSSPPINFNVRDSFLAQDMLTVCSWLVRGTHLVWLGLAEINNPDLDYIKSRLGAMEVSLGDLMATVKEAHERGEGELDLMTALNNRGEIKRYYLEIEYLLYGDIDLGLSTLELNTLQAMFDIIGGAINELDNIINEELIKSMLSGKWRFSSTKKLAVPESMVG